MVARGYQGSLHNAVLEDTPMKTAITRYRQGDVLISHIEALPEGRRTQRESGVVAFGEATGHAYLALHLPPGDYEVTIQREYTPEDIRHVRD